MKDSQFLYGRITKQIIDSAHKVFSELGYGYPEKVYQKALEKELNKYELNFKRESYSKIEYDGEVVGRFYLDFLVEGKIAVELKVRREIYLTDWTQIINYLKAKNLRVGLLLVFSKRGVIVKRVMN